MKKLLALFFAALAVVCAASYSYAGSADARIASIGNGISYVVGCADLSTGNTAEIDTNGAVYVRVGTQTGVSSTGEPLNTGTQLITGVANIQSITISGPGTAAGDYVLLYDATSATGTPKWEVTAGTAKSTVTIDAKGASVTNGIFANSNSDNVFLSVTY